MIVSFSSYFGSYLVLALLSVASYRNTDSIDLYIYDARFTSNIYK